MRKLILLTSVILLSCQDNAKIQATENYYELPEVTRSIIMNMAERQADVDKSFTLNGQSEDKVFKKTDSLFWAKELAVLLKTDLNAPKYRGGFELSTAEQDQNSNLLIDRLTATSDDVDLRQVEIYYLDVVSEIRLIKVAFGTKNFIAKSAGQINVWVNKYGDQLLIDSLVARGHDKVLFQGARKYETRLKRLRQ